MAYINILGLGLTLMGVLMLFRYGMPYHVPLGGTIQIFCEQGGDEADNAKEASYRKLGWVGISLVMIGTILQGFVSYKTLPL